MTGTWSKREISLLFLPLSQAKLATESLRETLLADQRAVKESSYAVSGILASSHLHSTSRSANLQEILQDDMQHSVYRFNLRLESTEHSNKCYSGTGFCEWTHAKISVYTGMITASRPTFFISNPNPRLFIQTYTKSKYTFYYSSNSPTGFENPLHP